MSARNVQVFSLRTKLVLFAAALVVVPGAIYGAITVSSTRTALSRVVGRELAEAARNAADRFATTLRSGRESMDSFARQDVMREIRIGDLDKRISSFLASVERGNPSCRDLIVLDGDDRVVASSNPSLIGGVGGSVGGAGGAGGAIEGPVNSPLHPRSSLRFSLPIPDPDVPQRSLGRLVALCDWERETEVAARARDNLLSIGLDVDVLIVDALGVVIAGAFRPGSSWRLGEPIGLRAWREHGPDDVTVTQGASHEGKPYEGKPDERSGKTSAPAVGHVDHDAGVLFGRASLAEDLPPWTVLVSQPLAEAFAPARRTGRLLAFTLAGVLLAALAVALAAARRVTRPLAELTAAAADIGRGRTPVPSVSTRTRDEIGTLAAAFDRMAVDLRRAERELVDAAKFAFVGELAAGVAHEVRTPLGVLRSSAQLLERSLPSTDDEQRELLQLLRDEVDRIDRVVGGLLELGRPRELRPEASAVDQVVFRALDFAEAQAREKGVAVRRRPLDPAPLVLCDPELIYQVALNLVVNAIQIVQPGGTVEVAVLAAHDGYAGFAVADDGPGVSAELRERIFEPFFTRRDGGAGLGLTFVRRVIQEHRGRVSVASENGRGTVFRVELPLAERAA